MLACASSARAPLRKASVNGSEKPPGSESCKTLVSVTAYQSIDEEVEALNTPTIPPYLVTPSPTFADISHGAHILSRQAGS
jgi:hypothetical protein